MLVGRESAHVGPDLGAMTWALRFSIPGTDMISSTAVREGPRIHLRVDRGNCCIESVNLIEMKAQREAMVVCHPTCRLRGAP
jgi:hypothetical protein